MLCHAWCYLEVGGPLGKAEVSGSSETAVARRALMKAKAFVVAAGGEGGENGPRGFWELLRSPCAP